MSRTPARFTQADYARAIRAAKQAGGTGDVVFKTDGTVVVLSSPQSTVPAQEPVEPEVEVVL